MRGAWANAAAVAAAVAHLGVDQHVLAARPRARGASGSGGGDRVAITAAQRLVVDLDPLGRVLGDRDFVSATTMATAISPTWRAVVGELA